MVLFRDAAGLGLAELLHFDHVDAVLLVAVELLVVAVLGCASLCLLVFGCAWLRLLVVVVGLLSVVVGGCRYLLNFCGDTSPLPQINGHNLNF